MSDSNVNWNIVPGPGNTLILDEGLGIHAHKALEARISMMTGGEIEFLDIQHYQVRY